MLSRAKAVYLATRKRHDQVFNTYFMRPLAAGVVVLVAPTPLTPNQVTLVNVSLFTVATALLIALPTYVGGLVGIAVLEVSYLFDCVDGMLARHKKIASKQGHLFDFFTDEIKAVMLVGGLGVRLWRTGGFGFDARLWPEGDPRFLLGAVAGVAVLASATSLTNFVRRPEMTGKETPVHAHYETVERAQKMSPVRWAVEQALTFLRFINHYPSHIWLFAAAGRFEIFFWVYVANNLLYLGRGWLGLFVRFGRPHRNDGTP